jgi:serine/threonine protein phosphatase PrpC
MIFIVNESVYMINVGDSRAICSESSLDGQTLVSQVK